MEKAGCWGGCGAPLPSGATSQARPGSCHLASPGHALPSGGHLRPLHPLPKPHTDSERKRNCHRLLRLHSSQEGAPLSVISFSSSVPLQTQKIQQQLCTTFPNFPSMVGSQVVFFCRKHDVSSRQNLCVKT